MRSSSIFLSILFASLTFNVSAQSQDWSQVGGSFKEQFYSPLTQVNQANVAAGDVVSGTGRGSHQKDWLSTPPL